MKTRMSSEDFTAWKTAHLRCMRNFDGKSGATEVEAAVRLWQRSDASGFRNTGFIGERNSSASIAVKDLNGGSGPCVSATVKMKSEATTCLRG